MGGEEEIEEKEGKAGCWKEAGGSAKEGCGGVSTYYEGGDERYHEQMDEAKSEVGADCGS